MQAAVLTGIGLVAATNWWSRYRPGDRLEVVTKPLATLLVIALALLVDANPSGARPWFVAGLVFCLAGDVALLPVVDKFIVGLGAFLVGHALFIIGALVIGVRLPWVVGAAVGALLHTATIGRAIVRSVRSNKPALGVPVVAYLAVIAVMATLLIGTGRPWAVFGAMAFVVSDSILGWNRFVRNVPSAPVLIMVTYHAALVGLALGLLLPT
jgi:uncharacterized membrane protein YhhN